MKSLFFAVIVLFSVSAFASNRTWNELVIPNTTCGDGQNYKIFYNIKSDKKIAFEIMGGGACWDRKTCKMKNYNKWINPQVIPFMSQMSSDETDKTPLTDHTMFYFPYCTGDVYSGSHQASNYTYYHTGYNNIRTTIDYLVQEKLIDPSVIQDLFVYGWSAGSIGAIIHLAEFDQLVAKDVKRTLILDSPGLHWGDRVWDKISDEMIADLKSAFVNTGMVFDETDGLMAKQIDKFCNKYDSWKIGILQGSTDYTMSSKYGAIKAKNHKKLVYSDQGILATTAKTENCRAWVIDSAMHTFMMLPFFGEMSVNDISAREFVYKIYNREVQTNIFKSQK